MKTNIVSGWLVASVLAGVFCAGAWGHPGSGIVVDDQKQVYFVHARVGIWKIDTEGKLVPHEGPGWHYVISDPAHRFRGQRWPYFPDGEIQTTRGDSDLLFASSFPCVIGTDGAFYYPEPKSDGYVHILRIEPGGKSTDYVTLPESIEINMEGKPERAKWIHGLTQSPDGAFYYAERAAIRKIAPDKSITLIAGDITVPDCENPPAIAGDEGTRVGPALRGLDVAADGTIYAAASACKTLLRITLTGEVSVVNRTEGDWSPTGVDVAGDEIYVLENLYINTEDSANWLPRIRKIAKGGAITTLATVTEVPRR